MDSRAGRRTPQVKTQAGLPKKAKQPKKMGPKKEKPPGYYPLSKEDGVAALQCARVSTHARLRACVRMHLCVIACRAHVWAYTLCVRVRRASEHSCMCASEHSCMCAHTSVIAFVCGWVGVCG